MPDTPQTSELAATRGQRRDVDGKGACRRLLGSFSVTEDPGTAETEVPLGPEAPVMTKSAGAVKVRLLSVSFVSLFVTVEGIVVARPCTGGRQSDGRGDNVAVGAARVGVSLQRRHGEEGDTDYESADAGHQHGAEEARSTVHRGPLFLDRTLAAQRRTSITCPPLIVRLRSSRRLGHLIACLRKGDPREADLGNDGNGHALLGTPGEHLGHPHRYVPGE